MDFSYYNNNNEKIKLNIEVGTKWDSLNIQNQQLNSIFAKVDDGDREVSDEELTLLQKLLKKADGIINPVQKNNVLENEELKELEKQIEEGKITIPKRKIAAIPQNLYGSGYIEIQHTEKDLAEIDENSKQFYETEINNIRTRLQQKYPESEYEIEIIQSGRGYQYNLYCLDCDKSKNPVKTLSQGVSYIRSDGIEFSLQDYYKEDITNDESGDYSNIRQAADFGTFTLIDKNGNTHELSYHLSDLYGRDVLDCRRVMKSVGEFLANLPQDTINKLIEEGVEDISFTSDYDNPLLIDEDYYRKKMDANGNVVEIDGEFATIISPKFAVPKREYKDLSCVRDDGYKIDIEDTSDSTSIIKITTPQGKQVKLDISGVENDEYHQFQLPKLRNMLRDLPAQVFQDLSDEITGVKFTDKWAEGDGRYVRGTNQIGITYGQEEQANTISFVHELGHAIDNQNGTMLSQSPEFVNKYTRLKELTDKLGIKEYSLSFPEEFFASTYAYLELPDDESSANHIKVLDSKILKFKDSANPEEKECYELFQSLKEDVKIMVEQTRKQSDKQRADNTIPDLVKSECSDLITEFNKYHNYLELYFNSQYAELDMIGDLSADDETFSKKIEYYRKIQTNEYENMFGNHPDLPEDIQNLFGEMITKLQELRTRIKSN